MRWQADITRVGDERVRKAFLWLPLTRYDRDEYGELTHSETRWWEDATWLERYTFRDGIHQWEVVQFFNEE